MLSVTIRPIASHGAKGLLQLGFNIDEHHPSFSELREQLLNSYRQHLCVATKLFPQIEELLHHISTHNLKWGIVTNKPAWLTEPLLKQLGLFSKAGCVVSGDSVTKSKPHPDPLLYACKLLNCQPHECVYIGDAHRDIAAGISAGMHTLIARYGYIADSDQPKLWNASAMIHNPVELIDWIKQQNVIHA